MTSTINVCYVEKCDAMRRFVEMKEQPCGARTTSRDNLDNNETLNPPQSYPRRPILKSCPTNEKPEISDIKEEIISKPSQVTTPQSTHVKRNISHPVSKIDSPRNSKSLKNILLERYLTNNSCYIHEDAEKEMIFISANKTLSSESIASCESVSKINTDHYMHQKTLVSDSERFIDLSEDRNKINLSKSWTDFSFQSKPLTFRTIDESIITPIKKPKIGLYSSSSLDKQNPNSKSLFRKSRIPRLIRPVASLKLDEIYRRLSQIILNENELPKDSIVHQCVDKKNILSNNLSLERTTTEPRCISFSRERSGFTSVIRSELSKIKGRKPRNNTTIRSHKDNKVTHSDSEKNDSLSIFSKTVDSDVYSIAGKPRHKYFKGSSYKSRNPDRSSNLYKSASVDNLSLYDSFKRSKNGSDIIYILCSVRDIPPLIQRSAILNDSDLHKPLAPNVLRNKVIICEAVKLKKQILAYEQSPQKCDPTCVKHIFKKKSAKEKFKLENNIRASSNSGETFDSTKAILSKTHLSHRHLTMDCTDRLTDDQINFAVARATAIQTMNAQKSTHSIHSNMNTSDGFLNDNLEILYIKPFHKPNLSLYNNYKLNDKKTQTFEGESNDDINVKKFSVTKLLTLFPDVYKNINGRSCSQISLTAINTNGTVLETQTRFDKSLENLNYIFTDVENAVIRSNAVSPEGSYANVKANKIEMTIPENNLLSYDNSNDNGYSKIKYHLVSRENKMDLAQIETADEEFHKKVSKVDRCAQTKIRRKNVKATRFCTSGESINKIEALQKIPSILRKTVSDNKASECRLKLTAHKQIPSSLFPDDKFNESPKKENFHEWMRRNNFNAHDEGINKLAGASRCFGLKDEFDEAANLQNEVQEPIYIKVIPFNSKVDSFVKNKYVASSSGGITTQFVGKESSSFPPKVSIKETLSTSFPNKDVHKRLLVNSPTCEKGGLQPNVNSSIKEQIVVNNEISRQLLNNTDTAKFVETRPSSIRSLRPQKTLTIVPTERDFKKFVESYNDDLPVKQSNKIDTRYCSVFNRTPISQGDCSDLLDDRLSPNMTSKQKEPVCYNPGSYMLRKSAPFLNRLDCNT